MTEVKEFKAHHHVHDGRGAIAPRKSFFEPLSPAQQLYESLRYVYTGRDDFFQGARQLVHLNGVHKGTVMKKCISI